MALFSLLRNIRSSETLIRPFKRVYIEFHTLRKLDHFPVAKKKVLPCVTTPKRNFFWIFKKRTKREIRAVDNPPDVYQLIYRNAADNYFLVTQYSAFVFSVTVGLFVIYYSNSWEKATKTYGEKSREIVDGNLKLNAIPQEMLLYVSGFIFIICLLYFFMARAPMRIYYHPRKQKYLIYFYGPIPNQLKKQVINVGEIEPLFEEGITPWRHLTYQTKTGQRLLLHENFFRKPADLFIMLGWQKDPNVEGYDRAEDNIKRK